MPPKAQGRSKSQSREAVGRLRRSGSGILAVFIVASLLSLPSPLTELNLLWTNKYLRYVLSLVVKVPAHTFIRSAWLTSIPQVMISLRAELTDPNPDGLGWLMIYVLGTSCDEFHFVPRSNKLLSSQFA